MKMQVNGVPVSIELVGAHYIVTVGPAMRVGQGGALDAIARAARMLDVQLPGGRRPRPWATVAA